MLPSKGFFNNFNCPFNEYEVCNRPHCHYRHFKKKKQKPEDSTNPNTSSIFSNYSADEVNTLLFSEIISEAVQNLLDKSDNMETEKAKPQICEPLPTSQVEPALVPTYKPTPISELSRRHLPTLYVPSRAESRKKKADSTERPTKKKRVAEYTPVSSKKASDLPVPEYCPSSLAVPESQFSVLAEELSFLDNIFDEKDFFEGETAAVCSKVEKLKADQKSVELENIEPQFSMSEEEEDNEQSNELIVTPDSSVKPREEPAVRMKETQKEVEILEPPVKIKEEKEDQQTTVQNVTSKEINPENKKDGSKSHKSRHSSSKRSSSSHRSSDRKSSSHHSSSSRHKSSSKSKDDKSRRSTSKSSHYKSSRSSSQKKDYSSKSRHRSSSSHSKHKSSRSSSSKKSSSNSKEKNKEKHICNCKYCPISKKNDKHSEYESQSDSQSASDDGSSSSESVIYCSPASPKVEKIEIISSSDEEISNQEDNYIKNSSDSEAFNDIDTDLLPNNISDEQESEEEEDPLAKKVLAKFKEANYNKQSSLNLQASGGLTGGSKKRVARDGVANASTSWPQNNYNAPKINKKDDSLTPAQLMAQRWEKIKQIKNSAPPNPTAPQPPIPGKVRIAHVPNVSSLIERKKELFEQRKKPITASNSSSVSNSSSKPVEKKPEAEKLSATEVSALLKRQLVGNHEKITDQEKKVGVEALTLAYSWLYDIEEAREKALELEKTVSAAAHQVITYRRALLLKIKSIADQAKEVEKNGRNTILTFNTYSFTYGHNLYLCFEKFLLTEDDLNMYGYPRPHSEPGCACISENVLRKDPPYYPDNKRVCEKCTETFSVDENGYPVEGIGKCIYHARKGFIRNRTNRHLEDVRHKCCRQEKGSPGCITSKYHACHNVDPSCLTGYIVLKDPPDDGEKENNIYALDCEMIYTTKGRELARLTIIDVKLRTTFDQLIKPKGKVLDCITQWSGISESDLKSATVSFEEVQRYLRKTFNSKTILVGHGLENDLRSMKLLHERIVDTSVVFPHKYAPQMKESLQRLAEQFLQKLIQTGEDTLGHSSEEDARTCMELMLMKIKEDCKQYAPKKVVNLNISRR